MKIIGHRGARGLAPENTIAGLQKALQHLRPDIDQIEFDVRVTKDTIPILHHDARLVDPDGQKHLIRNYTFQELKQHKPDLTTLSEALDTIGARVTVYIEVKPDESVTPITKLLRHTYVGKKYAADQILLASKSQKTLLALHKELSAIPKIVIEPWSGMRATYRARQVNTKFISMNQRWLWSGFIQVVNRRGYKLYAYTLNDPIKAKKWSRAGLYAVVTDYPHLYEA